LATRCSGGRRSARQRRAVQAVRTRAPSSPLWWTCPRLCPRTQRGHCPDRSGTPAGTCPATPSAGFAGAHRPVRGPRGGSRMLPPR
jgi:hypothetical protein